MDIKVIDEKGLEVNQEQKEVVEPEKVAVDGHEFLISQVAQMFDLKPSETAKYSTKINTLIDYAKSKTEKNSPEDIKWAIRSLSLKLGTPPLGEKLITYLTRYAYLATEKKNLEKEMEKYENGNN